MASIDVQGTDDGAFRVEVREAGSSTTHRVRVPEGFTEELGFGELDQAELVEESFRFLLEREPKESILQSFELPVIRRYFPEYPKEIKRRLG